LSLKTKSPGTPKTLRERFGTAGFLTGGNGGLVAFHLCSLRSLLLTQIIWELRLPFSVETGERPEKTSHEEKAEKAKTTKGN
jgi:hypothetical protein